MTRAATILLCCAIFVGSAAGCGSSGSSTSTSSSAQGQAASGTSAKGTSTSSAVGVLSAEAKSAATGDIPDTQVFLTYTNPSAGYSISYPEGWTRKGAASDITFSDKNNIVHIAITAAEAPTATAVTAEMDKLKQSIPTLTFTAPTTIHVKAGTSVKTTYTTRSAPNPVTGKTVLLVVDRYELSNGRKRATVDLGTPKGVDNVDAYRMMINGFRWR